MRAIVCSRTLQAADHPELTIIDDAAAAVAELKGKEGIRWHTGTAFRH